MRHFVWSTLLFCFCAACSSSSTEPSAGGSPPDASTGADSGTGGSGGGACTSAMDQLLNPVEKPSTGEVKILSADDGVKTVYVDASAGGTQESSKNPRVYLNLETAQKIAVTDRTATTSTQWDLAIKRPVIFTNSGHGGTGQGGAVFLVGTSFDGVTSADAGGKAFAGERFVDDQCNPQVDQTNAVKTSFDAWYDYDQATNGVSPKAGTWLVKGATGKLYKLEITSYYANPDGTVGQAGGRYTLRIGAL